MRFWALRGAAGLSAALSLLLLGACGGGNNSVNKPTQVVLSPTILSLNEGAVQGLSAVVEDAAGNTVAADVTFTSSNNSIATVSIGGLVCGGMWDNLSTPVNCNATVGQGGVGQVTITAAATAFNLSATATVYVHLQVDQVQAVVGPSCTTTGQVINLSGLAFNTTAPGCSPSAPCDITSTVGPFSFGSNDAFVASSSSGINPTFSAATGTPTYVSGGTITGSKGQTCDLSNFNGVVGATGTVALTGTNAIAQGTQLTITAPGHGATVAPTTATLSNGTATCSGTAVVSTVITSGVFTAQVPGATTVFASVAGVNSVGTPYLTCPVHSIVVHDAGSSNTTFTLAPSATQALTADVYDTNNQYITPVITWGSSTTDVATAVPGTSGNNPGTVTAAHGGTAYVTATCSYPDCNRNIDAQYSQNVATVNVTTPSATTVYAASTNSTTLVPINTSTNVPGTPITLPFAPNSILASPDGGSLYLGSSSALMGVSVATGAVVPVAAGAGTVVAISPDGLYLLISNSTTGKLVYFNTTTAAVTGTASGTTVASAFSPDSKFNESLLATTNLLEYGPQTGPLGTMMLASNGTALDISGTGSLTYITSASGAPQIFVYSTCNVMPAQMLAASGPTLIKALPNATGAVATDPPNLDVITTPAMLNAGCPITTQSTINSYDLGAGSFTARQVLVSTDATHAYIISDLPQLLSFDLATLAPVSVPIIGGAVAASGGITVDGSRVYLGTSDVTVHEIDTAAMADFGRIEVGLKDANGNPTVPNLVAVVP